MKQTLILLSAFAFAFAVYAQDIPYAPVPPRLVNDFAKVMTDEQTAQLEYVLDTFARSTTTQICVVTVPSLNGYDIADYAFKLGEKWG
ncbi:MAG: TPM domain-containing protein, partial [Tannerella sp.]|nr:TPM domain-containing protein [Tannerella sp.]